MSGSSNSCGSGLRLAKLTGNNEMQKLLECPVCLDIAHPRIFTCLTGHIICCDCKTKLKLCVLCKSPYTSTRNFPLESIVQSASFYCEYHYGGCDVSGTIDELKGHLEKCAIRPLKCHLSTVGNCKGTELSLSNYISHLQSVHNLPTIRNCKGKPNVFVESYTFNDSEDWLTKNYTWSGNLFYFDGHPFVTLMRNNGPMLHFGFFLVGSKSDAVKYTVNITMQNKTINIPNIKYNLTTTFPSIREFQENALKTNRSLPHLAVIHKDFLKKMGHDKSVSKIKWYVQYEIVN